MVIVSIAGVWVTFQGIMICIGLLLCHGCIVRDLIGVLSGDWLGSVSTTGTGTSYGSFVMVWDVVVQ